MTRSRHDVHETVVHRALGSPARVRLLELLRRAPDPMPVSELAEALELHPNTVRSHLAILENAQLVDSESEHTPGPGRPRVRFRVRADHRGGDADAGYRLLSAVLAERVRRDHGDVEGVVEEAAARLAQELSDTDDPPDSDEQALERLTALVGRLGFGASVTGELATEVELTVAGCPVTGVARHHPEVACSAHRGLLRGLIAALGGRLELADLVADPADQRCRAVVRRAT